MPFTIDRWRTELRAVVADIARDPQDACARGGTPDLYLVLLGCTMQPIAAAYHASPNGVISALISVAGSLGVNLAANLMQHQYPAANPLAAAVAEAQSAELGPAYRRMATTLDVITLAEAALQQCGHPALSAQIRAEHARQQGEPPLYSQAFGAPRRT